MANVLDYIKWRGDLSVTQDGFNEVDGLILSRASYFPFESLMKEGETVTFRELGERYSKLDSKKLNILWPDDVDLIPAMGSCKRFGEMQVTKYDHKIIKEKDIQYAAVTILMPNDTIYVSYRGTDSTVVGWKEDLNMTFMTHVASQIEGVKYLEQVAKEFGDKKILVGGHSKGGNVAVYSAMFASKDVNDRIITVYNNEGPGFNREILETEEYKEIIKKVETYIPQDSVFGRMLYNEGRYTVVKSNEFGVMQHDLYSWEVEGNSFVKLKEVTNGSKFIDKALKDWLEKTDPKKREQVIETVFEIINTTNIESFKELVKNPIAKGKIILSSYKGLDEETKDMVVKTITMLFKIMKDNFVEETKLKSKAKKEGKKNVRTEQTV